MKKNQSGARIRRMPYQERLRNYEREKDELFMRIAQMDAADVAKAHFELVRKWGI